MACKNVSLVDSGIYAVASVFIHKIYRPCVFVFCFVYWHIGALWGITRSSCYFFSSANLSFIGYPHGTLHPIQQQLTQNAVSGIFFVSSLAWKNNSKNILWLRFGISRNLNDNISTRNEKINRWMHGNRRELTFICVCIIKHFFAYFYDFNEEKFPQANIVKPAMPFWAQSILLLHLRCFWPLAWRWICIYV